jgi:hypothetical protein
MEQGAVSIALRTALTPFERGDRLPSLGFAGDWSRPN